MSLLTGYPKVVLTVTDKSIIQDTPIGGILAVAGITRRGRAAIPVFCGNEQTFIRRLGNQFPDDDDRFPFYCIRMLQGGAKLWVVPVHTYTTISDPGTVEGTKASIEIGTTNSSTWGAEEVGEGYNGSTIEIVNAGSGIIDVAEVLATGSVQLVSGTTGSVESITVDGVEVMSGSEAFDTSLNITANNVAANITANTSAPNYTAVAVGDLVTISGAVGSGSSPNAFVVLSTSPSITINEVDFSGGVYQEAKKDISITLTDSDETITLLDVAQLPNAAGIIAINEELAAKFAGVELTLVSGIGIQVGTGNLAGGIRVVGDVDATDFGGDALALNGWYAFDIITSAFRIAQLGIEDAIADESLRAYVVSRQDMRYHIATPLGLNGVGIEAFRDGTSPYSHTAHDTYLGSLVAADVNVTDTRNVNRKFDIPGLVDVMVLQARKDVRNGAWWSAAGPKRGKVVGSNNGISSNSVNLLAGSQQAQFDVVYKKGTNAVVDDAQFGVVYWGNKSLQLDRTSLLNKENVADLIVYLTRELKPLARIIMFEPTLPSTWKELYRRVRPLIQFLETNKAIIPGEDVNWFWQGDQDANKREDAIFNTQTDLDAGKYKVRFVFIPVTATEFIGIDIVPTDSGSVKFVVQEGITP